MRRVFKSPGCPFELTEREGQTTQRRVRSFSDMDEALRFLRQHFDDAAMLADLRRWAGDFGIFSLPGSDLFEILAGQLVTGQIGVVDLADPPPGGSGGGTEPKKDKPDGPKPQPKPKPKPEDKKTAELVVIVKDADGNPIEEADVTAGALGNKKTDASGVADYGTVEPGTYDIAAHKPGHSDKKKGWVRKHEKKQVSVPDGTKTTVDLVQHPCCANVAFFEGPTSRPKYFGFDHKTDMPETDPGHYWKPCPERGALSMPGNKLTRDGARWVSVAVGQEVQLEIDFDFKNAECIPCISNCKFEVVPASIAQVVTKKVTARKAVFKIKGKAKGEASLKVICDGDDLGWFHIWCEDEVTIKLDVACLVTNRAPSTSYSMAALRTHFEDIFRQACIKIDMLDLGDIDLTGNAALATIESNGYPASGTGVFLEKSGTPRPYDSKGTVLNALNAAATTALAARTTAPLARAGAYRLYWYVPTVGCSILGTVLNIGSNRSFGFAADSSTARNSCAHEFGHCLNLRHPSDGSGSAQYAAHILSSRNAATPAYDATNTEPSSAAASASSNVLADDPTNLMGYWSDRPNRKRLRYHQWKAISRS